QVTYDDCRMSTSVVVVRVRQASVLLPPAVVPLALPQQPDQAHPGHKRARIRQQRDASSGRWVSHAAEAEQQLSAEPDPGKRHRRNLDQVAGEALGDE